MIHIPWKSTVAGYIRGYALFNPETLKDYIIWYNTAEWCLSTCQFDNKNDFDRSLKSYQDSQTSLQEFLLYTIDKPDYLILYTMYKKAYYNNQIHFNNILDKLSLTLKKL